MRGPPLVGGVHDRMPMMLLPDEYDTWLGPNNSPDELRALLRPYDANLMEVVASSTARRTTRKNASSPQTVKLLSDEPIAVGVACVLAGPD